MEQWSALNLVGKKIFRFFITSVHRKGCWEEIAFRRPLNVHVFFVFLMFYEYFVFCMDYNILSVFAIANKQTHTFLANLSQRYPKICIINKNLFKN